MTGANGGRAGSFVDFDERLVGCDARNAQTSPLGVMIVRASHEVQAAIIAHAARRLCASGWLPVDASSAAGSRGGAPLFREIATQLGLAVVPSDPHACADEITRAAFAKQAAIIAILPKEGTWDRAVANELVHTARSGLVIFVTGTDVRDTRAFADASAADAASITTFDLGSDLTSADKLRWLGAVAEEAHAQLPGRDIRTLEAWWARARRVLPADASELHGLSETARGVLACLALAGRSLPVASLETLGNGDALAAVEELVVGALAVRNGTLVSLAGGFDAAAIEATAGEAERLATARLLAGGPGFDPDPWAYARAAELLVSAGAIEAADRAIQKSIRNIEDAQATYEITSRWFTCVAPVTGEGGLFLRVQAAHRALDMGEANDAQRWCESATALKPEDPTIALLMGKALMQLGDLVAARVSLQKAQAAAGDDELRARVASELAELSYLAGDLKAAAEHANRAIALAQTVGTRLSGRNTIGKMSLVEARWDDADAHFAEDVLTASSAGDKIAELRARLNRGIALMSKGGLEDARVILARVLDDGMKIGEDRACAYAFANLGVIASRQHDYASALGYWEQAIRFRHTLRGRIASARTIANLAELRLRLGLVDHAEHALTFGRRLLGHGTTAARASHFSVVGARIALSRAISVLPRLSAHRWRGRWRSRLPGRGVPRRRPRRARGRRCRSRQRGRDPRREARHQRPRSRGRRGGTRAHPARHRPERARDREPRALARADLRRGGPAGRDPHALGRRQPRRG